MNLEEHHYGEEVDKITLDGVQPFGNSYQFEPFHLENKKIKKKIKTLAPDTKTYMNIVFSYRQTQWNDGDTLEWVYNSIPFEVVLLDSHMLSVKGKKFYQYVVGVKP